MGRQTAWHLYKKQSNSEKFDLEAIVFPTNIRPDVGVAFAAQPLWACLIQCSGFIRNALEYSVFTSLSGGSG